MGPPAPEIEDHRVICCDGKVVLGLSSGQNEINGKTSARQFSKVGFIFDNQQSHYIHIEAQHLRVAYETWTDRVSPMSAAVATSWRGISLSDLAKPAWQPHCIRRSD